MEKKWMGFLCSLLLILGCLFYTVFHGGVKNAMASLQDVTIGPRRLGPGENRDRRPK